MPTKTHPRDKYDDEVGELVNYPELVHDHWCGVFPLFQFATPSGYPQSRDDGKNCGCPTLIRTRLIGYQVAWTPSLTSAIRQDQRLPANVLDFQKELIAATKKVRRERLNVFAEWPRRLDREIRGGAA